MAFARVAWSDGAKFLENKCDRWVLGLRKIRIDPPTGAHKETRGATHSGSRTP